MKVQAVDTARRVARLRAALASATQPPNPTDAGFLAAVASFLKAFDAEDERAAR
jgi:hypothetical protein